MGFLCTYYIVIWLVKFTLVNFCYRYPELFELAREDTFHIYSVDVYYLIIIIIIIGLTLGGIWDSVDE